MKKITIVVKRSVNFWFENRSSVDTVRMMNAVKIIGGSRLILNKEKDPMSSAFV